MDPCIKPNLLLLAKLIMFVFSLFSLSPKNVLAVELANASAPAVSQLVEDFCNDKLVHEVSVGWQKAFCLQVFGSDPRSATVSDRVTLAKIGLEQADINLKKIGEELSSKMGNLTNPSSLKPILESCVGSYEYVMGTIKYYFNMTENSRPIFNDYMQVTAWDYDIKIDGDKVNDCQAALNSTVPRDDSLVKKSEIAVNYYYIGFKATGVMAHSVRPPFMPLDD